MKYKSLPVLYNQILLIHKPPDWTSFDVVKKIRRLTGVKKVGHAGSLDPFATGVLLVCTGPATKEISRLMQLPKEYIAEISLGKETDTLDPTGKVTREIPVPPITGERIREVLKSFIGQIDQEIPAYSAIKYNGVRLYQLARTGKKVPKLSKKVVVYQIELLDFAQNLLKIRVICGSGTYIRALARDISHKLGTVGHLKSLIRTRIGDYTLENSQTIADLDRETRALKSE